MAKQGIERIANEIYHEDADGETASPLRLSGKAKRRETARIADDSHQRDRPNAQFLKLDLGIGAESPDRFEGSAREGQGHYDDETDQRARAEENCEQGYA